MKHFAILTLTAILSISCQTTPSEMALVKNGNQYAKDGLLREAASEYNSAIEANPKNFEAHRNLGMVLVKAGEYKKAISHLKTSLKVFENNFETNFYLAEAFRMESNYSEAIYRYQKASKIKPRDIKATKALAWSYFNIHYYSQALKTIEKIKRHASKDGQISIIHARTLLKLNKPNKALTVISQAKSHATKSNIAYFNSVEGDVFLTKGNITKASQAYREALKRQPLLAGALLGIGKCYSAEGDRNKAIKYIERATRIKPSLTEGFYLLGQLYQKIDRQKSLNYYAKFKRRANDDPEFSNQLNSISRIFKKNKAGARTR